MRGAVLLPALLILSACGGASDTSDAPEGALVGVTRPTRGTSPDWLTAYGSATPSQTGAETISINQPGQVERLLTTTGARVAAGQPLLLFALSPGARAGYEQAVTQVRLAREQRDTARRLFGQQLATRDQLAQADKAVTDAETALAALAKDGAAEPKRTIRAPFAGTVTAIAVAQGDRTQPGTALATIARDGGIVVTAGVPSGQAASVHAGQTARITPLDGGSAVTGQVVRVDQALNPQTRLVDVDVSFPAGSLLAGAPATVEIATAMRDGWQVPHEAVVTADGNPHVFQLVQGKAKAVPVRIAVPGERVDLVTGALDARRPLIVSGAYQVADGDPVRTH